VVNIYSTQQSNRLQYIAETLFGTEVKIFTHVGHWQQAEGFKLNYSVEPLPEEDWRIVPHGLLFQENIEPQLIAMSSWRNLPAFYMQETGFEFDVLAASFYLLSRYEEYLPHILDNYLRYSHTNSLAYRENFLKIPLVNLWWQQIAQILPQLPLPQSEFSYLPTYDIDIAYQTKAKGWFKNVASIAKALCRIQLKFAAQQVQVLCGGKDRFDVYNLLDQLHQKHGLKPIYFWLVANRNSQYDKNILPHKRILQNLLKHYAGIYNIGLHPSWQSFFRPHLLAKELKQLEAIVNGSIILSRQHYIQLKQPTTYTNLLQLGIKADYSMGYGSINGFRASYCKPYQWYNLATNQSTDLVLHPFCYMDANSFFEQKNTVEVAAKELESFKQVVQSVNGQLITIFHNHFLAPTQQWKPWLTMYQHFLQTV
jgi:hypothetical protein